MKDFCGFRFGNFHSEDLHLVVVSSGNRYEKNLLPEANDHSADVPGGNGRYYFGSTHETREFTLNIAFDSVDEPTFRKISQLFATDKLQDLVFDELPYKTYKAKIKSKPDFKHICFMDRHTHQRVYKGEGTLHFMCYEPYAYGFNKYIVRAADYYRCLTPQNIITGLNPKHTPKYPEQIIPGIIKDHYNVRPNMNTPWKGGYPTLAQVQAGELYFTLDEENRPILQDDCSETKSDHKGILIDVRGYWDNIPEWQSTAKLLTSPTLDFDQELIFMPQYNKINYLNMDTGLNNEQGLIGSRVLVYNPGDVPVDFELKLNNVKKRFRAEEGGYSFRVNRYNVQRLSIPDAVDWTGLKTYEKADNEPYKYGKRYFKILEQTEKREIPLSEGSFMLMDFEYRNLKNAHPNHCYIVEPIPHERMAHFIKLFYWQSYKLGLMTEEEWEEGIEISNRYQELYDDCQTEEEIYELYWHTLKDAILFKYEQHKEKLNLGNISFDEFCYEYIHNPPEYIKVNEEWNQTFDRKYGQFDFNLSRLPQFLTEEYFQIRSDKLYDKEEGEPKIKETISHSLFLDSSRRMLYNVNNPEWKNCKTWLQEENNNPDNFYNYKPTKTIRNEAIEQGHWFQLPPGWSLISIEPVIDENRWGGKLWKDARPFQWSSISEKKRVEFNTIYEKALRHYLINECPESIKVKFGKGKNFEDMTLSEMESCAQFRRWFGEDEDFYGDLNKIEPPDEGECIPFIHYWDLGKSYIHWKNENAEYKFLKLLASYWNISHLENGKISSTIDDWWWYANNYIWANFPPLYWGYMDLLNSLQIKYTPLFY